MTSFRQIEANRRNALRSAGPKSHNGKRRSRRNALRHGLTAETVIAGLEDTEDYRAFEAAVISDYEAETAVERELVLRLASLLWRMRRAISIETDLLTIQAEILRDRRHEFLRRREECSDENEPEDAGVVRSNPINPGDVRSFDLPRAFAFCDSGISTTALSNASDVTTPRCGDRPCRRSFCSNRRDGLQF